MANTINWLNPATGAVSPTAAQVAAQNEVIVDLTTDGALTSQVLTHNMGISAADIALGRPNISVQPSSALANTTLAYFVSAIAANTITLTFAAVAATIRVKISRPHTLVQ